MADIPGDDNSLPGWNPVFHWGWLVNPIRVGDSYPSSSPPLLRETRQFKFIDLMTTEAEILGGYLDFGGTIKITEPVNYEVTLYRPDGTVLPSNIIGAGTLKGTYGRLFIWNVLTGFPRDISAPGLYKNTFKFTGKGMTGSFTGYFFVEGEPLQTGAKAEIGTITPTEAKQGDEITIPVILYPTTQNRTDVAAIAIIRGVDGEEILLPYKYFTVEPNSTSTSMWKTRLYPKLPIDIKVKLYKGSSYPQPETALIWDTDWKEDVVMEKIELPALPGFWEKYGQKIMLAFPLINPTTLLDAVKNISTLYAYLFDKELTETKAFQLIDEWLFSFNSFNVLFYGKDLAGNSRSMNTDDWLNVAASVIIIPELKIPALEAKAVGKITGSLSSKVLKEIVENYDKFLAKGFTPAQAAEAARKIAFDGIFDAVAKNKTILSSITNKFLQWKWIIGTLGAVMGYDSLSNWASLDNVASAADFDAGRDFDLLRKDVITKEEALNNLEKWNSVIAIATKQVETSAKWNILTILFGEVYEPAVKAHVASYETFKKRIIDFQPEIENKGTLEVYTQPTGANVYISGVKKGTTPYSQEITIGMYDVGVELFGYKSITKQFIVDTGKISTMNEILEKVTEPPKIVPTPTTPETPTTPPTTLTGILEISSNVVGAEIYIDGIKRGVAPFRQEVGAGNYSLVIYSFGYTTQTREVSVSSGEITSININLEKPSEKVPTFPTTPPTPTTPETPTPTEKLWKVTISSIPSGAKILINGSILEKSGYTSYTPDYAILRAGSYNITVSKTGYAIPEPVMLSLPPQ